MLFSVVSTAAESTAASKLALYEKLGHCVTILLVSLCVVVVVVVTVVVAVAVLREVVLYGYSRLRAGGGRTEASPLGDDAHVLLMTRGSEPPDGLPPGYKSGPSAGTMRDLAISIATNNK